MTSRHREVEHTYDVEAAAELPPLVDLPDVASVGGPLRYRLEAHYFDTEDLALGRRGITLRRRTGGNDDGWHLKLPVRGARQEIHAPLGRTVTAPPIALRRIVQGVVREVPLGYVATVTTERTIASLRDGDDALLAELCDDSVVATRAGDGGEEEHVWREWEVELHAAAPRLSKALRRLVRGAGAVPASGPSKLGRLMRLDADASLASRPGIGPGASEHDLLSWHLVGLVADLQRLDPMARADLPDAVHQLRLVVRRFRSALRSFSACFDGAATEQLRDELRWIGDVLGRPRDLEVLQEQLSELLMDQPRQLVRGRMGTWMGARLRAQHRAAHQDVLVAMASDRYFALVDALEACTTDPPWSERPDRKASTTLPKVLHREWRRVEKAVKEADSADQRDRAELLHRVRKKAKRVRYAAEALKPVLGAEARDTAATAKKVQRSLGAHHDAHVAIDHVLGLADAAYDDGRDTFTLGLLAARLEAALATHDAAFRRTWKRARAHH